MLGATIASVPTPTSSTVAELRSIDRAIWPFLRASSRRLGVGFSVLLSAIEPRHPPRVRTAWATDCCMASPRRELRKGSDAAMTVKPTRSFAGRPTTKTFI